MEEDPYLGKGNIFPSFFTSTAWACKSLDSQRNSEFVALRFPPVRTWISRSHAAVFSHPSCHSLANRSSALQRNCISMCSCSCCYNNQKCLCKKGHPNVCFLSLKPNISFQSEERPPWGITSKDQSFPNVRCSSGNKNPQGIVLTQDCLLISRLTHKSFKKT